MPASTRLRAAGAVIAGCLLATTAPGALAQAATPPVTVAMTSYGDPAPRYDIRVRNGTDGMVRTTVRQELPPGATPFMISQGGAATPPGTLPGQVGTEVVWQVQLGARSQALLSSTLAPPAAGADVTAPACAFVAGGAVPYDCATTTWVRGRGDSVQAGAGAAPPWWRRGTLLGTAVAALALLLAGGGALWWRRRRRRRIADQVNAAPPGRTEKRAARRAAKRRAAQERAAERQATAAARRVRRSGGPIARARARVRGDNKIPAPESVRRATGHPRTGSAAEPAPATAAEQVPEGGEGLLRDGGLARTDEAVELARTDEAVELARTDEAVELARTDEAVELARTDEAVELARTDEAVEDGLVGIAGGARYVGRAPIPPRSPAPDPDTPAGPGPGAAEAAEPPEPSAEELAPVVGRARPAPHPATTYRPPRRRPRPPAWAAVGTAALLAVALAALTAWTGSSQVSAINGDRQPSSGAWVGSTVAGPVGTSLRESAFEFTVYRLTCPPAPGGCQAIVGVRNLTDRSQEWHGTLQRAYLPNGDWVGADVPATQIANAGRDPFADPVPAGERVVTPLVFAATGGAAPTRIELRSAVFSAGVSVDVPH
ncbi:hypothetical protein ACN27G_03690 [Plantactinospora sp. WMMB334]|uniref:hypothetical protein n=1 Tax=Plantactinospora sp. WMMB334 TaxID=3404119 RepID=UPI003B943659